MMCTVIALHITQYQSVSQVARMLAVFTPVALITPGPPKNNVTHF